MLEQTQTSGFSRIAATIFVSAILAGCGSSDWIRDRITASPSNETEVLGAPDANTYIGELGQIAAGDASVQAEAYADAAAAARLTPGPSTNLRLGLVLAIPGHPNSDPDRATTLLRSVLEETELLTQAEISLAHIMLNSAERQSRTISENRRLRDETSRTLTTTEQQAAARQSALEAENRWLRNELADAQQKLEALTSIERDIRDR